MKKLYSQVNDYKDTLVGKQPNIFVYLILFWLCLVVFVGLLYQVKKNKEELKLAFWEEKRKYMLIPAFFSFQFVFDWNEPKLFHENVFSELEKCLEVSLSFWTNSRKIAL